MKQHNPLRMPGLIVFLFFFLAGGVLPLAGAGLTPWTQPGGPRPAAQERARALPAGPKEPIADQPALPGTTWFIEPVDAPKLFGNMGDRSLALDTSNLPHIAYGADHLYYARHDGLYWQIETVDDASSVGTYTSLALDSNDHPHISYHDKTNYDLKYAHYDGASWQTKTVDGEGGAHTSLALDSNNHPHISYCAVYPQLSGCYELKYAHYDGVQWQIETVDSAESVGSYTSLALDPNNNPHISYYDAGANGDLKYAHYDGTSWQIETVDSDGWTGEYTSLALDSAGRPHISYHDSTNGDLRHAHYDGAVWHVETVDSVGDVGEDTSLALDAVDHPHISYYDWTNANLKYARYDGNTWHTETVDNAGEVGEWTSLALDTAGRPHISYRDGNPYSNSHLKYARFDGSKWQIETVDGAGQVGWHTSLALDSNDHPHISYCQKGVGTLTCDNLKFAHYDGTAWYSETVDGGGDVGGWNSLALDSNDHPHISYCLCDAASWFCDDLRYAHHDGTAWHTETVDSEGNVGWDTSLALDQADRPHISYSGAGLKYAYLSGTTWISETVDSAGSHTSLALDAVGRPHISYSGGDNDLMYAHFNGSTWQVETVDSAGWVGDYTSLALDANDHPHISYCRTVWVFPHSYYCGDLKYAHYDGTAWHTETVDSEGYVGEWNSLVLDAAGRPHISYCLFDDSWSSCDDLKYAYHDGRAWNIETVDSEGRVGRSTSLALDADDHPHISYGDMANVDLKYAHAACVGVAEVTIDGPDPMPVGIDGLYTAAYTPITASLPLTFTWDNGSSGPTVAYSWTVTGTHTLHLTATNDCGEAHDTFTVTVFCQPLEGVEIHGPRTWIIDREATYQAIPQPITASRPLSFTWDSGAAGPTAVYMWQVTGTYTLTVTGTNICGGEMRRAFFRVHVLEDWPYKIYLPLVLRGS